MTTTQGDALLKIDRKCQCWKGTRLPPLRIKLTVMMALRGLVNGGLDGMADDTLLTYRCPDCSTVTDIRIRDLYLA